MTVVAYDGRTLAADRRATSGDGLISATTKIHRVGDALVALTGDSAVAAELLEWFRDGADRKAFPTAARDDKATLIAISQNEGITFYTTAPVPIRVDSGQMAWGSGRDFALAAMRCGKTAREAVALACDLNAFCGNGIDTLGFD